jgi:hypothetical protein
VRTFLICLVLALNAEALVAFEGEQPRERDSVHWAMSSFLGTGWYRIDDSLSVFVVRMPPRQVLRESWYNDGDDRGIGVEIKYTTSLGVFAFDTAPNTLDWDDFGIFSFTPGVELEVPVTRDFYLRPFAHFGWGADSEDASSAWIWFGGIKTRYRLPQSRNNLAIIGNVYYGGFDASDGKGDDDMGGLALGLEGSVPLGRFAYRDTTVDLDWHAMYTYFSNEPVFTTPKLRPVQVQQMLELGLALSPRKDEWDLWLWKPERLGLAVKWDPDTDFLGLTINFTSWFRR